MPFDSFRIHHHLLRQKIHHVYILQSEYCMDVVFTVILSCILHIHRLIKYICIYLLDDTGYWSKQIITQQTHTMYMQYDTNINNNNTQILVLHSNQQNRDGEVGTNIQRIMTTFSKVQRRRRRRRKRRKRSKPQV